MMNRLLSIAFLFVGTAITVAADDKPQNLLPNGGFEDVTNNKPVGYQMFNAMDGKATIESNTDDPKEGKRCMLLKGKVEWALATTGPVVKLEQSKNYTLTAAVRVKTGIGRVKIDYLQNGKWVGQMESEDVPNSGKWELVKITAPGNSFPEATHLGVAAIGRGEFEGSFDDFVLTAAGKADAEAKKNEPEVKKAEPAANNSQNLLADGGFENVANNKPVGFTVFMAMDGKATIESSTDDPKEGKRCMLFKGKVEWAVATGQQVKIDPSKNYTLTAAARVKTGIGRVKLDYFQNGKWVGQVESEDVANSGKWEPVKITAPGNSFPEATHIGVACVGRGEFDVSFDDFVLTASTRGGAEVKKPDAEVKKPDAKAKRGDNLLTNGGFEDVANNKPTGYQVFNAPDGKATIE